MYKASQAGCLRAVKCVDSGLHKEAFVPFAEPVLMRSHRCSIAAAPVPLLCLVCKGPLNAEHAPPPHRL